MESEQAKAIAGFAMLGVGVLTLLAAYLAQLRTALTRRRLYPWVAGALLVVTFFVGRRAFGGESTPQAFLYWIGVVAVLAAGIVSMLPELRTFLGEVREELRKVVWPSKEETQSFTLVVLVAVAVVAVFVGALDMVFTQLTVWLDVYGAR